MFHVLVPTMVQGPHYVPYFDLWGGVSSTSSTRQRLWTATVLSYSDFILFVTDQTRLTRGEMAKASGYVKKGEAKDSMESLNVRLAADLRGQVRSLGTHPIFSDSWLYMANALSRMAVVSDLESALPQPKEDATLWETEEQAVRYILEDGKLNVCLRSLIEFKDYIREYPDGPDVLLNADASMRFECAMGTLLYNAWLHIESIQITDMNALISHITNVLIHALANKGVLLDELHSTGTLRKRQEIMGIMYIYLLLRNLEELDESRFMPTFRKEGTFTYIVQVLMRVKDMLPEADMLKAVEALSIIVQTEDFNTYREEYISGEDLDSFLEFKKEVLQPLQSKVAADQRRLVRPVGDAIDKSKRLLARK